MNHIDKFFKKLSPKQKVVFITIVTKVRAGDIYGLNIKKLEGKADFFRVRKGTMRIIFEKREKGFELVLADFKDDNTYNF